MGRAGPQHELPSFTGSEWRLHRGLHCGLLYPTGGGGTGVYILLSWTMRFRNISHFSLRWMKIMIPLSSSLGLVEELIITASPTVMGTDCRMIWPSVMTAMTRRRRKMIPWRSKSCHYNVDIVSVMYSGQCSTSYYHIVCNNNVYCNIYTTRFAF